MVIIGAQSEWLEKSPNDPLLQHLTCQDHSTSRIRSISSPKNSTQACSSDAGEKSHPSHEREEIFYRWKSISLRFKLDIVVIQRVYHEKFQDWTETNDTISVFLGQANHIDHRSRKLHDEATSFIRSKRDRGPLSDSLSI